MELPLYPHLALQFVMKNSDNLRQGKTLRLEASKENPDKPKNQMPKL